MEMQEEEITVETLKYFGDSVNLSYVLDAVPEGVGTDNVWIDVVHEELPDLNDVHPVVHAVISYTRKINND